MLDKVWCLSGQRLIQQGCLSSNASGHNTVCIALQRIEERTMSQAATRKGTREKRPSRFHYYEDTDFNALPGQKIYEQKVANSTNKEKPTNAQEINQIAKLLYKFMIATNTRYQELNESQQNELMAELPDLSKEIDSFGLTGNKKNEGGSVREVPSDPKNQRSRELGQLINKEQKGTTKESKARVSKNGKTASNLASCLQTDLSYHHALNEHVKSTYPNINSLSPNMLRELSIPTDMLQKQANSRAKCKEEKKGSKISKDENKPFKRQSYHIAIAYHIHLKYVRINKPPEYLDPTYEARKLRQQTHKQGQGG